MSNKLAQQLIEKTSWTESEELASKIIGDRRLYGLRLAGSRKVRFFIVTGIPQEIEEVTSLVARVCRNRLNKDGWILAGNYGYCSVMGLAETYAQNMGKTSQPSRKL